MDVHSPYVERQVTQLRTTIPAIFPLKFYDDGGGIKFTLFVANNLARVTSAGGVELPGCIGREETVPYREGGEINNCASEVNNLA